MRSLLVSPIEPARSGNGLAMRAGAILDALARYGPVDVAVLPLAGDLGRSASVDCCIGRRWSIESRVADAVASVSDPYWRAQLAELEPRPAIALGAWPASGLRLARQVRDSGATPDVVVGLRSYLAPVAAATAKALGARLVIDLDDDDVAMASDEDRAAWGRLVMKVGEWSDAVAAASPIEAEALSVRLGCPVACLPNVVTPRSPPPRRRRPGAWGRRLSLLFVGNLTYEPNRAAALELVETILPLLPKAELTLVGNAHDDDRRDWSSRQRVDHAGWVADPGPYYDRCDVVLAPIRRGGGTRIKLLEAMAACRPVVATPVAVAGLAVEHGRQVLIGDRPGELATAAEALRDDDLAARLVAEASSFVRDQHHPDRATEVVGRLIGAIG